jgi:energy-coupling factor transport system ATP-binding protein
MPLLDVRNAKYAYHFEGGQPVVAVNDVSFAVEAGQFVALVGHNGSGKSTLAKMLNGLIIPNYGDVLVDGMNTREAKLLHDIRKTVGVVFQNPDNQMVATIIEDDIAFGPENLGVPPKEIKERVEWALAAVGMTAFAKRTAHRLSGGQKQRVAIAGALAIRPRVLVLDEATSMLDPQGRREVMETVRRLNRDEGMTVVMITHFMEEAVDCDRIFVLNRTRLALQGGRELFLEEEKLKDMGLDVPPAAQLCNALRAGGVDLAPVVTEDALVEAVCRLNVRR